MTHINRDYYEPIRSEKTPHRKVVPDLIEPCREGRVLDDDYGDDEDVPPVPGAPCTNPRHGK